MERLKCKACGSYGMVPMDVEMEGSEEQFILGGEQETRFYTCHVCGDNWLSMKETDTRGDCQLTFIHQMGTEPVLKRVAHMATPVLTKEETVDHWEYYVGEEPSEESNWFATLTDRRKVLRSICSN